MIDYLGMVEEFHKKYSHYIHTGSIGDNVPLQIQRLRDKLIKEETTEFLCAISPIEIADALADLLYVTFGAALAYGIPIDEIFTEVHRSNMTKSKDIDSYGKTIKGPDYESPDIERILYGK